MSIKPPSDIVMDVALAADPTKRAAATQRLAGFSAGDADASFTAALTSTDSTFRTGAIVSSGSAARTQVRAPTTMAGAMSALETVYVRTALETMLPDAAHVKGFAGAGAGVWKSMLADALANSIAASGGLHILPTTRDGA